MTFEKVQPPTVKIYLNRCSLFWRIDQCCMLVNTIYFSDTRINLIQYCIVTIMNTCMKENMQAMIKPLVYLFDGVAFNWLLGVSQPDSKQ